ncbi:MAG: sugar kinase [Halobacteriaceae archaeon]
MPKVITAGEILVEIMRKRKGVPFTEPSDFIGPFPSGAPAIFVDAVANLGMSAGIIGSVGEDGFGECILNRFKKDGVDASQVRISQDLSTGVAFVSYSIDDSREFIYHMGNSAAGTLDLDDVSRAYVTDASAVHVNGSSLSMSNDMKDICYKIVDIASEEDLLISLDPNLRTELKSPQENRELIEPILEEADIVTPTTNELEVIANETTEATAAKKLLKKGVNTVAVKKGEDGCTIYRDNKVIDFGGFDVSEVDPTGAGDAFSAAVVVGTLEGMDVAELGEFANAVGANSVTMMGPMEGIASREDIDALLNANH